MWKKKYLPVIFLSVLLVIVLLIYVFNNSKGEIKFYLLGEKKVIINIGDTYQDDGFIAINSKGNDLSEYVNIKDYVNNKQVGTYAIKYTFSKDNITKEIVRIIEVVSSETGYNLALNGSGEIKIIQGNEYQELGASFYDNDGNLINIESEIIGFVNTDIDGIYNLKYILQYEGHQYETFRNVEVYELKVENISSIEENGLKYTFYIDNKYYDYAKLPDGTIIKDNIFSYTFSSNGTFSLEFYDKYNNKKDEKIVVSEIIDDLTCIGTINRSGTILTIGGQDKDKFNQFEWYFNGVKSSENSVSYQKVTDAYVIFKSDTQTIKVSCNIKDERHYNFEYDFNNLKPEIKCNSYTESDRFILEGKLKDAILEAGYGTRAGVVEAARFLVGALDYRIRYLGPKKDNYDLGRYPKTGLNIANSNGWGCSVSGYRQGIDCTNFVSWAFIQNGLVLGTVYSPSNVYKIKDVVEQIQVGDLVLTPYNDTFSHVGIVIGIDNDIIYVAESTSSNDKGVVITRLFKNNLPSNGELSRLKIFNYKAQGNITNMWVK